MNSDNTDDEHNRSVIIGNAEIVILKTLQYVIHKKKYSHYRKHAN
jgi:hypothetical protein